MTDSRFLMSLIVASLVSGGAAMARPAAKHAAVRKPQSDVTVTQNPDGSVEVRDNTNPPGMGQEGGTATTAPATTKTIYYKPAPPATVHYGDGVVVRRNPDGSVDVTDEDSMHPAMHSLGAAPVHYLHARSHHSASHAHAATAKPAAKKK